MFKFKFKKIACSLDLSLESNQTKDTKLLNSPIKFKTQFIFTYLKVLT